MPHIKSFLTFLSFIISLCSLHAKQVPIKLSKPTGQILLIVSGNINATNKGDRAVFDKNLIHKFPKHAVKKHTQWDGNTEKTYIGISLEDLLEQIQATGETMLIKNKNGEEIKLTNAHLFTLHPILAYQKEGGNLSQKHAPLVLIFPETSQINFDEALTELTNKDMYGVHRIIIE